jgi:hypothetical protein
LSLNANLTANLQDRVRQERTTVHGALCAALVLAGRQLSADWRDIPPRILSPINTRRLLHAGESCGMFLVAVPAVFDATQRAFGILRATREPPSPPGRHVNLSKHGRQTFSRRS